MNKWTYNWYFQLHSFARCTVLETISQRKITLDQTNWFDNDYSIVERKLYNRFYYIPLSFSFSFFCLFFFFEIDLIRFIGEVLQCVCTRIHSGASVKVWIWLTVYTFLPTNLPLLHSNTHFFLHYQINFLWAHEYVRFLFLFPLSFTLFPHSARKWWILLFNFVFIV